VAGCLRGCVGAVGTATVLLVVAWGGWRYGGSLFPTVERWAGVTPRERIDDGPQPTQAIADDALDRFNAFRTAGLGGSTLSLSALELTSIVRYALPGIMPEGVADPTVSIRDDRLALSAEVAVDAFPDLPAIGEVKGLLPDTVRIEMGATLLSLDRNYAALVFDGVEASGIPLPDRVIPGILEVLGRSDREGLPRRALAIPLPQGVGNAYARDGALVFVSAD
jgi:hypothetical protein